MVLTVINKLYAYKVLEILGLPSISDSSTFAQLAVLHMQSQVQ
jgi:hypothetical protein